MDPYSADILISILIEITATLGLVFNGFGFHIALNSPKFLSNTFGHLCLNHCIANFGACLIFLFWITPLTLTQDTALANGLFGKIVGQVNTFFWDVTTYSHVVISLDRMISVTVPIKTDGLLRRFYQPWLLVSLPWIWAFLSVLQFFKYDSCYDVYHPDLWLYSYADTRCGQIMPRIHFVKDCILFTTMVVVDMVTLYFLRKRHNILRAWSVTDDAPQMSGSHRRSEIRFFIQGLVLFPSSNSFSFQTVVQGMLFFCIQLNHHVFSHLNSSKLYLFFFITFQWVLCHTLDGLIMCIFQLKRYTARLRAPSASSRIFLLLN